MRFKSIVSFSDNKRIYPLAMLEVVIANLQESIKNKTFLGQIGFPDNGSILLSEISHFVTSLVIENNEVVAEIEVLPTPKGKLLEAMIERKCVTLKPFGAGTTFTNENGNIAVDNYNLIGISAFHIDKNIHK